MTATKFATMIGLAALVSGCTQRPASPPPQPAITKGFHRVFLYPGEGVRPQYIPDKSREIRFIDVGHANSSGVVDAVDGGAWNWTSFDGGAVGFVDGSTVELKEITVVRNNWTDEVVAVEVK